MNEFLIQLIVVAVLANVVLLLAAVIVPRLRRPSHPSLAPASPGPGVDRIPVTAVPFAVTQPPSATPAATPAPSEAPGGSSTEMPPELEDTQRRFRMPPDDEYPSTESIEAFLNAGQARGEAGADRMIDDQTGLDSSFAWEVAVDREEKRVARYGKSVTVVVAELDRLEALAARLGRDNADRLVPPVALTLRRLARAADLVARTGTARFQILMPETDEIQAINYVERVRDACDMWLDAAAVSVRLVVGWANAGAGVTIRDATRLAEQRMHADRARPPYGRARPATWTGGRAGAAQGPADDEAPEEEPPLPDAPSDVDDRFRPGPTTGPTI